MLYWANLHPYSICTINCVHLFPLTSLTNSTTLDLLYEGKELEQHEFLDAKDPKKDNLSNPTKGRIIFLP